VGDRDEARRRARRLFERSRVADLAAVEEALGTRSRTTVFRVLSAMGYLTSFSHAGRFYTLEEIPEFDEDGLWSHGEALFSRWRTLRETLVRLVEKAPAGHTHGELRERVGLRVQDTLHDLTRAGRLDRAKVEGLYVYVSVQKEAGERQVARRRELLRTPVSPAGLPDAVVLEVLLEVVRAAGAWTAPEEVARRLEARGLSLRPEQVATVFREYGVEKKTARRSRSRRSPR